MNRLLLTAMLWHWALSFTTAQDAALFNQVIASTGKTAVQQGLTFTYTVGEAVIPTFTVGDFTLTQGFHQPEHTRIVSVDAPGFAGWDIEAFPNPVSEFLVIRYNSGQDANLSLTVVDLFGRSVLTGFLLTEPAGSKIDCRAWQPGVYVLLLQDSNTRRTASVRVIRL